jgi:hypothetical protein
MTSWLGAGNVANLFLQCEHMFCPFIRPPSIGFQSDSWCRGLKQKNGTAYFTIQDSLLLILHYMVLRIASCFCVPHFSLARFNLLAIKYTLWLVEFITSSLYWKRLGHHCWTQPGKTIWYFDYIPDYTQCFEHTVRHGGALVCFIYSPMEMKNKGCVIFLIVS